MPEEINRNMGCIEMNLTRLLSTAEMAINRNMGCIEIHWRARLGRGGTGLIETWDVLKLIVPVNKRHLLHRLIETWDVLKLRYGYPKNLPVFD